MISALYRKLEFIATNEFADIINESTIINSYSGRVRKLRLKVIDKSFIDVWYSFDGDYSFHWEQRDVRNAIYRHDNAPHKKWNHIKTFPKHCHDGTDDNVIESYISEIPERAIRSFLEISRNRLFDLNK